jgi:hypothetical protein
LDSSVYLAKNQNHKEMLKISIKLTATRKPGKPDGLISMRRPTPPATTVSTIPAANEINHAGKYDPKTSSEGTRFCGEQLTKKGISIKISSLRVLTERNFER